MRAPRQNTDAFQREDSRDPVERQLRRTDAATSNLDAARRVH
jgi:hypothetical protein